MNNNAILSIAGAKVRKNIEIRIKKTDILPACILFFDLYQKTWQHFSALPRSVVFHFVIQRRCESVEKLLKLFDVFAQFHGNSLYCLS